MASVVQTIPKVVQKAQAANDPAVQFELAYAYGNYWYGVEDQEQHSFWLEKSAAQNYLPAVCALSSQYYNGTNRERNYTLAEKLADKAYSIYLSKPESERSKYDVLMTAGALSNKGYHAKSKEDAQKYLCLAKNMNIIDENRIFAINYRIRERNVKCN